MLWKEIRIFVLLSTLLATGSCSDPGNPRVCQSGLICPSDKFCAENQDICISNSCGNGIVDIRDGELCDDGNVIAGDGCSLDCTSDEKCGNGLVDHERGEECDDGGQDTSVCNSNCTRPECGDGWWNSPVGEVCDDGNLLDTDGCSSGCELTTCTDRIQNNDETDVDCGGHCGPSCAMLQSCSTDDDCMGRACLGGTCVAEWRRLTANNVHTCALLDSGTVRCWGEGRDGLLGYGNEDNIGDDEPASAAGDVPVGGSVTQITTGYYHTCALLSTGAARCWGGGILLGYGNTNTIGDNESPASAGDIDIGNTVIQLTAGEYHTCALLGTGAVRCWGYWELGRLGYGNVHRIGDDEAPPRPVTST